MKKTPPLLYDDLIIVWEGFNALNSTRIDFEAIKFSEIEAWLNLNAIYDVDYRQEIAHLICVLDGEYLIHLREKNANSRRRNKRS